MVCQQCAFRCWVATPAFLYPALSKLNIYLISVSKTNMAESMEGESDLDTKPVKEVPVINDQGVFRHDTGDTYDGFFEAKKKDRSVKMHGPGTYTTAEGDIYSGTWENDRLGSNQEVCISFTDGSRYEGFFKDWSYNGTGKYIYADGSVLAGDFVDNTPVGQLTLTDPNGHKWMGKAEHGFSWFDPVNHFYEMLERSRDLKRVRRSELGARSTVSKIKTVQSVINPEKEDQAVNEGKTDQEATI